MISEQPSVNLRPMSIGEMLDRAFTVYLKNALVLTAALVVVLVPLLILNYLGSRDLLGFDLSMFQAAVKNPNASPPAPDLNQLMQLYTTSLPFLGLTMLLSTFALPFANAAVIAGVSRSYLGQRIRFADCYRDALARWPHILILAVLWIVALVLGVVMLEIVFFILAIGAGALGSLLPSALDVALAFLLIPAFLWILITSLQAYLAWALSFAAITLEHVDPVKAFASSFSRVFGRGSYWRSVGLSAAIAGIGLTVELIVGGAVTALYLWLKLSVGSAPLALSAFGGLVSAVITPLSFAIVAMYYYDVRIRREGFDLEHLTAMLTRRDPARPASTA
ncbi:MAG TPA: hypothetical protein VJN22_07190 [Candidatus Eremiobacteraceae bacterium]|nr:hypothetical protein [Candidatus Eremiobacteraceae bacterium]